MKPATTTQISSVTHLGGLPFNANVVYVQENGLYNSIVRIKSTSNFFSAGWKVETARNPMEVFSEALNMAVAAVQSNLGLDNTKDGVNCDNQPNQRMVRRDYTWSVEGLDVKISAVAGSKGVTLTVDALTPDGNDMPEQFLATILDNLNLAIINRMHHITG